MKPVALGLALLIALNAPGVALAQRGGGGGGGGSRPQGGGGGSRPSAPASRPAPSRPAPSAPSRPAPSAPSRPSGGNSGGFNIPQNSGGATRPSGGGSTNSGANRPSGNGGNTANRPNGGANGNHPNVGNGSGNNGGNRPNVGNGNGNHSGNNNGNHVGNNNININNNRNTGNYHNGGWNGNGYYGRPPGGHTTVVVRPGYYPGPAYGWNRGVIWAPVPTYWGGGFWGSLAIGVTSAAVFGAIVSSSTNTTYTSYQVQPDSPGATLLKNYQLTQVQCGPPGLVQIFGPADSVICANPNSLVAAGDYDMDASQLTLISQ